MKSFRSGLIALVIASSAFASSMTHAAVKKYQVTGVVLEMTDKMIVVQKDDEKWEIGRDADLKVEGKLKVGAKVTIYYTMTATSVEVKDKK